MVIGHVVMCTITFFYKDNITTLDGLWAMYACIYDSFTFLKRRKVNNMTLTESLECFMYKS